MSETAYPVVAFRFQVEFLGYVLGSGKAGKAAPICLGSFSDCTGLEATMEPKVIKAGGANYGPAQRPGPVTFATVILKRGMTTRRDLWNWYSKVNQQAKYALRFDVTIKVGDWFMGRTFDEVREELKRVPKETFAKPAWSVRLLRALPIKFKAADLNARGQEVGIEELHLAHEGLTFL